MHARRSTIISVTTHTGSKALLSNHPVGALVGHARPVVSWVGLSFNMANRQKFRYSALLVRAFLLLDIIFNIITTAM